MAWNNPKTWASGNVLTASDMNTYVRDNTLYLYAQSGLSPSCRVYNNAAISVENDGPVALTFNTERWDTDDMHSTVSNTGRLTCATPGIYHVYGSIRFASNNTGNRFVSIRKNGSETWASNRVMAIQQGKVTMVSVATEVLLDTGDYVELLAYQSSGGALNVESEGALTPEFGATWLRALP